MKAQMIAGVGAMLACAGGAQASGCAARIFVDIHGLIIGNQVSVSEVANLNPGDTITYSFAFSPSDFEDSGVFPIRGYRIDQDSFRITSSGGVSIGIRSPYPAGATPMFVVRDNDPAVDGFFLSESIGGFPSAINTDQDGVLGDFEARFNVTYTGDTLSSLDIFDAVGSYDFTGLTVFGMGINDGFIEDVVVIDFSSMTIDAVLGCNPADIALPCGTLDFSDVVAFLTAFGAMDPIADFAAPFGSFDFSDVVAFLTAFGAGCP